MSQKQQKIIGKEKKRETWSSHMCAAAKQEEKKGEKIELFFEKWTNEWDNWRNKMCTIFDEIQSIFIRRNVYVKTCLTITSVKMKLAFG